jgi:uncharacterized membrane protein
MAEGKKGFWSKLKAHFTTGLLAMVPLTISLYLLWWIFSQIDSIIGGPLSEYLDRYYLGIGFVILLLMIWLVGFVTSSFIGKKLFNLNKRVVSRIPILGTVFKTISQISSGILDVKKRAFKEAVLVELFGDGKYSIGFLTSSVPTPVKGHREKLLHVFIPTAPNPTSGYLMLVEERRITKLEMPFEDAFKSIVSAGMVVPAAYE